MSPFLLPFLTCLYLSQATTDTLLPGQNLGHDQTLVSSNGLFELGIFSTSESSITNYLYLGIWFKNDANKKPVWVGNREDPLFEPSGTLSIGYNGNLVLTDKRQLPILVNSAVLAKDNNTSATLLGSGNFVLKQAGNEKEEAIIWQSFHYPSDTLLPGMRLGWIDINTDHASTPFLVSWQSPILPASGIFSLGLDTGNKSLLKVWDGYDFSREIGFWDGGKFNFLFQISSDDYNFRYVSNSNEIYLTFSNKGDCISWFVMASSGVIREYKMIGNEISMVNRSICGNNLDDHGTDCFVLASSKCPDGDRFVGVKGSMPGSVMVASTVHGYSDCEIMCRSNCSCVAFASDLEDGTGCAFYYGDRQDFRDMVGEGNSVFYIRGDSLLESHRHDQKKRMLWLVVVPPLPVFMVFFTIFLMRYFKHKKRRTIGGNVAAAAAYGPGNDNNLEAGNEKDHELHLVNFCVIEKPTNSFSSEKKIGEGGFGPVYKCLLLGHEVAVKRLAGKSGQGLEEFKNEVQVISKLQHRNLVRLLGYCIEREEKILIYEFLENGSLDSFLFDSNKKTMLDWKKRFNIMEGIAQGLLYLHKYSRLRIIHRDLKTSNILLDGQMNPKISDFGMARICPDIEARERTTRVVGTYGYMPPEYVVRGLFSTKSDVFSFGVIMLEIISGRRNTTFSYSECSLNLLGYAWHLWQNGRILEFADPTMANSFSADEFLLCIEVALLCVQESPKDRPKTSDVVSMLTNESTNLAAPKQPAFTTNVIVGSTSTSNVTFSEVEAR